MRAMISMQYDVLVWPFFDSICFFLGLIDFWCLNITFSNMSAMSWGPVLVVEEAGVPGENHRPWASNW
jgi:hypothetical protein